MRNSFKFLTLAAAVSLVGCIYYVQAPPQPAPAPVVETTPPAPPPQPAPTVVEYQPPPPQVAPVYEDDLAPYGRWFVSARYGRCWIPYGTPYGWQPYTVGHWMYTDDGACCWVSEDREVAWGGIVYHYGQWVFTPDMGWIWVPGTTWAPAWVAWRDGGGYCGWAPLPPEACYQPQVTAVVIDQYVPPQRYVFVNEVDINEPYGERHFVQNNVTIINRTTNITSITVVNNRVINRGVPVEEVESRTGHQVPRVALAEATSPEDARRLALSGQPVRYTSPKIDQAHVVESAARVQVPQNYDAQVQQENQAAKSRQDELEAQRQQQKQAADDREAARQKQLAADQEAARQKQIEHDQQVAAEKQAEHDRQVQRQQAAEAARQAAKEKADAEKAQADKPSIKKPKPQQPGTGQPPQ